MMNGNSNIKLILSSPYYIYPRHYCFI